MRVSWYFYNLFKTWFTFFVISKLFFVLVNLQNSWSDLGEFPLVWWNGLRLDLSIMGYIFILPLLLLIIKKYVKSFPNIFFKIYNWLVFSFLLLISTTDPYFYKYWGQKCNLSFTQFLGKENAGLVSIATMDYIVALIFATVFVMFFKKRWLHKLAPPKNISIGPIILFLILSFLMLRGGWSKIPINISSAFYSNVNFYNYAALNPTWNLLATEFEKDKHKPLKLLESEKEALDIWHKKPHGEADIKHLLRKDSNSNILLIVLESFSAKTSDYLSGKTFASTPNLDGIMAKGITYSNAYASSFRSDKGLLALTMGVPSGARQTLTNFPQHINDKPNVFGLFDNAYNTSFYYGGNMEFANIKILFSQANQVNEQSDFNQNNSNAWGVHDEVVFDKFYNDFINEDKPQFKMLFSLSSHEPFDVPGYQKKSNPYLNSISYTDSCLGVLFNKLQNSDKWDNTLIILTADHGTIRPDKSPVFDKESFRIPIVLTGGIVQKDTLIKDVVSQIDIPQTIALFKESDTQFNIQNSLLKPSGVAFYSYYAGLAMVQNNGEQYFDFGQKKYLSDTVDLPLEKAYYHLTNKYFFNY